MINSHKTTQVKRRKRAADLIGLFAKVNYFPNSLMVELNRGNDHRSMQETNFNMHIGSKPSDKEINGSSPIGFGAR